MRRSAENPYEEVLADTYESAYARRLRGFESPTYRMPSSYYDFRYGNSFNYVSAYDPAFYNVMVMGDQVWVEPKYITAMFGSWGRPSIYVDPWYYGWNYRPYHGWGFSFGSWGWSFGWHDPWYYPGWNWGWGYPGWGYPGPPHWGGWHRPHRPYASNIVHRADPNTSPSGGRYYRGDRRPGGYSSGQGGSYNRGSNRNGDFGVRNSSGGSRRPYGTVTSRRAATATTVRAATTATTVAATTTTAEVRTTTVPTTAAAIRTGAVRRTTARAATTGAAVRADRTTVAEARAAVRAMPEDVKRNTAS